MAILSGALFTLSVTIFAGTIFSDFSSFCNLRVLILAEFDECQHGQNNYEELMTKQVATGRSGVSWMKRSLHAS